MQRYTNISGKCLARVLADQSENRENHMYTTGESLVLSALKDAVGVFFGDKSVKEIETMPVSNASNR